MATFYEIHLRKEKVPFFNWNNKPEGMNFSNFKKRDSVVIQDSRARIVTVLNRFNPNY